MNYEITFGILAVAGFAALAWHKLRHELMVSEGFAGLLYRHGKFVELLAPGRHVRWGRGFAVVPRDLRKAVLAVAGQEVLTADNVSLKLSVLVGYQVVDPIQAAHVSQNWMSDLYHSAQLELRKVINAQPVESLLGQRLDIGKQLLAQVQPEAAKTGITVHTLEVKDVMFSADLKRAFADVLKAKQESQSALERARGESAALRNLANASRLMDGNPALMNLRLMQSVSAVQGGGNTLVLGVPGGFVPLEKTKSSEAHPENQASS